MISKRRSKKTEPDAAPDGARLMAEIDREYLRDVLRKMLGIPSPSGYTDNICRFVAEELRRLGFESAVTRRGAIRCTIAGKSSRPTRAVVGHVDTLGAMVTQLKSNGRLACSPIGTWSPRFAEGARVTVFSDEGHQRGTILPLKASGHAYGDEVDEQPVTWDNLEIRVDDLSRNEKELFDAGFRVGDYISIDPQPEFTDNGYVISRHLDDKAGVACMLASMKVFADRGVTPPIDCDMLFTIFEEVGSGASGAIHRDVAEMVTIDTGVNAPGQNTSEYDVTIAMMDSSGPFDYHLTHHLLRLAREHNLVHGRDVFKFYRSDAASAIESGNDIRTGLLCFGVDATHGYERTHIESLLNVTRLLVLYIASKPAVSRDRKQLGGLAGFPELHTAEPPVPEKRAADAAGQHEKEYDF